MRPYRVHELLTRHAQGKRRGRAEQDDDRGSTAARRPTGAVPDAFGHVQEDGTMMQLSAEARNLNWLVSNFVERVPGVQRGDGRVVRRSAHRAVRRPRPQLR